MTDNRVGAKGKYPLVGPANVDAHDSVYSMGVQVVNVAVVMTPI